MKVCGYLKTLGQVFDWLELIKQDAVEFWEILRTVIPTLLKKETLWHKCFPSCEFCEISKNIFSTEHLGTTDASVDCFFVTNKTVKVYI